LLTDTAKQSMAKPMLKMTIERKSIEQIILEGLTVRIEIKCKITKKI
jgi:hypothetical protein